jgi:hypothetical protein
MIPDRINEALWRIEALEAELEAERALADQLAATLGNLIDRIPEFISTGDYGHPTMTDRGLAFAQACGDMAAYTARRSPKEPT